MHVEADNVLLTVTVAHEAVHILSPFLNLRHTLQIKVILVESGIIVHLLVAESELPHLVAAAAQDKDSNADARCFRL